MAYLEPWLAGTPVSGRNLPCITTDLKKYGLEFPGLYDRIAVSTDNGNSDFKDLIPEEQERYIVRIQESNSERDKLVKMNPILNSIIVHREPGIIFKNREIIINHFSVADYGKRLFALYQSFSG
jgi:hypothetical protein